MLGWLKRVLVPEAPAVVTVDETGVSRGAERVPWAELVRVEVLTTDEGPFAEDVWWLLHDARGGGCAVPGAQAGVVLPWLQRLPGFRNEVVILAMGSTENARFLAWEGEGAVLQPPC